MLAAYAPEKTVEQLWPGRLEQGMVAYSIVALNKAWCQTLNNVALNNFDMVALSKA